MATDPNWTPEQQQERSRRLREAPVIGPVMRTADEVTPRVGEAVRSLARRPAPPNPSLFRSPAPTPPASVPFEPAGAPPSADDIVAGTPLPPGMAGLYRSGNEVRGLRREDVPQFTAPPEVVNTDDTTDYAGIRGRGLRDMRGSVLAARGDAANFLNPTSSEAEILRRAENAAGSYFLKGRTGARNAIVQGLLGQLDAGNQASLAGVQGSSDVINQGVGAELASGLEDRKARLESRLGLRRGAGGRGGEGGMDAGDLIDLMQLEETRRANLADEAEKETGRVEERVDSILGDEAQGFDPTSVADRAAAQYLVQLENDPNFFDTERGQQLALQVMNEFLPRINEGSTAFSERIDDRAQFDGEPKRLGGVRIAPGEDRGLRGLLPFNQGGSLIYTDPDTGEELAAVPLESAAGGLFSGLDLSPAQRRVLDDISKRQAARNAALRRQQTPEEE